MNLINTKNNILLLSSALELLCILGATSALAQEQEKIITVYNQDEVDTKVEYPHSTFFPAFKSVFISPDTPKKGYYRVIVSFIVETDGRLTDIQIIKGDEYGLGDAVKNALSQVPPWTPAIKDGKNVRSHFLMPFTIEGNGKLKTPKKKK